MQFILRERIGRFHRWRRCPRCLDFQITRLYTPSSNHQALKPFAKPKRSRYVFPPAAPCKSRPAPSKVPQARQTEGSRSRGSERKLHDWVTEHRYIVYTFAVFVSGTTFCSFALQRVPITGRMQLDFIPSWVARRMAKSARKNEDDLRENLEDCSLRGDHPAMQGVNLIFERLVRASGLGDREWEFRVVLAPTIDDVCVLPSSSLVLVFSGICQYAVRTDDELAAMLAHEVAHVLANHVKEEQSWGYAAKVVSLPFRPFEWLGQYAPEALIFALPLVAIESLKNYLSRRQEEEADYIGLMLMADAGFDPSAAVSVWKKMKETEDNRLSAEPWLLRIPQWMSTHPHSESRIRENERWIPEILEILEKEPSTVDGNAVRVVNLAAKRRIWKQFLDRRNELQIVNRGT